MRIFESYNNDTLGGPRGGFETFVNGRRPGPCRRLFSFFGWGAAQFVRLDEWGRYLIDERTNEVARFWRFGRVTIRPIPPLADERGRGTPVHSARFAFGPDDSMALTSRPCPPTTPNP